VSTTAASSLAAARRRFGREQAQLLDLWRRGHVDAGRRLYREHAAAVYRFLASRAPEVADDLLQQVFVAVLEQRARPPIGAMRPYLFGVARNHLRMYFRRQRRLRRRRDDRQWQEIAPADAEHTLGRAQVDALVHRALAALPERYRVVLQLHHLERRTIEEIAAMLCLSHSGVKMRLVRGRARLAGILTELGSRSTLLHEDPEHPPVELASSTA
jgi:RNA polymerase sigma-70 factor (ECF subfamily)